MGCKENLVRPLQKVSIEAFPVVRCVCPGLTMDALTSFGLFAVTAMLVFYALEDRSPWFILAFAGGCVLASVYGFLQGAWPFGVIEAIWALVAVRRWQLRAGSSVE